jgi:hypothetical protein
VLYFLAPTSMGRPVQLAKALDSKRTEVSFSSNMLLISVCGSKDQFEAGNLFTNATDKRRVERLVDEICRVFDIIDTLQLPLKALLI